ncbi:hypothetical protein YOLOSWAG_8 [Erwinia phage vB_EamM_Yoloswag]|uniref:Uncharacterized protein n=1 Tax=Erwinia phage vB_EamM_Yoloswag TaxID=1958956 RepID=A0A1S6L2T1_9CAUD|nr:hypothetical protein HOR66_gp008 [Erwinia phage vB_EamM_Yoloswag]AQT28495.1 hypothetical protein YOLOSWAG_8 [Erwinia phage vB_EamM_Yoloswag]
MSGLFTHRVFDKKEGFVFVVAPVDDSEQDSVDMARECEDILNSRWEELQESDLTVDEVRDGEEAELIYPEAVDVLSRADYGLADCFIISSITVIGKVCIVHGLLALADEDEDEDDDSIDADEEDFD